MSTDDQKANAPRETRDSGGALLCSIHELGDA
jgi:hypothetical protein